jgi:ribosomal protein S27AE
MANGRDESSEGPDIDADRVYDAMDPLEPYTTGELASVLDVPKRLVRRLLDALAVEEKIRKKEPEPDRTIWIRAPPKNECPQCGRGFEIKYSHPIFQAARYCPKCGTQIRRQ